MRTALTFIIVALAGLLVWMGVQSISGSIEAWDSNLYFIAGIPLMLIAAAVAGYRQPELWWVWGIAVVSFQVIALFWQSSVGALWFVGLVFSGMIAAVCTLGSLLGKRYHDRRVGTTGSV